jgi:hypothetical protein
MSVQKSENFLNRYNSNDNRNFSVVSSRETWAFFKNPNSNDNGKFSVLVKGNKGDFLNPTTTETILFWSGKGKSLF